MENQYVFQFHNTMVDSLGKEPKEQNQSLMLLTKECEEHFSIMHQLSVMRPYIENHWQELHEKNQDKDLIIKQHKLHFTTWLKDLNLPVGEIEEEKMIHLLTSGPHNLVKSWQVYDLNGCTFYTKAKDSRSQCQNSGVRVDAEDGMGQKMLIMGTLKTYGN
jgi:hypothetical protein